MKLNLISLRNQKIKKVFEAHLDLLEDRLHYLVKFVADEPVDKDDKTLGDEEVQSYWESVVPIWRISGVELEFAQATKGNKNENNHWCIIISASGMQNDIKIFVHKKEEADKIKNAVVDWLFKN